MSGILARLRSAAGRLRRSARLLLPPQTRPAILMYHRIAEESFDPWGQAVTPTHFATHIRWLAEHRTVLPLAEFVALHRAQRLPADAVSLTFDDGYACAVEQARPLLDAMGLTATVFLPADLIDAGREFWWDELERIVLEHPAPSIEFEGRAIALGQRQTDDRDWSPGAAPRTDRQRAYHAIWSLLRDRRPAEIEVAMAQLRIKDAAPRASHRPMSWREARDAAPVLDVGSHGRTHPFLPKLDSMEKATEIGESRRRCADRTGNLPPVFAYPFGAFDADCMQLASDAGYDGACTTAQAFVDHSADSYALPRLHVGNWELGRFARMMAGRA